jgi:ATP-dependent Clp protease ATP-binding subunit ClpC
MAEAGFHHGNPAELPLAQGVRQLIADARQESIRLDHEYIGTEHFVLALSHQVADTGPLRVLDVDQERVDDTLCGIIQRGQRTLEPSLERPFTSRTKHAFALAAETAHDLGHAAVDVPHVLVGLLRERLNIGAQVLADQGLTAERAYEYARRSGPTD